MTAATAHRLPFDAYISHLQADAHRLAVVARQEPAAAIAACPGWDMARLVTHLGQVHRMAGASVEHALTARPGKDLIGAAPEPAALLAWYEAGAARLIEVLRRVSPEAPAWNFTGQDQTAAFWSRRQAHETVMHRWDGEDAVGKHATIDADLALDGIDEFFEMGSAKVLPGAPAFSLGGSLHLHATDAPGEWMLEIVNGELTVERRHGKGDAAVRGSAQDLLLGLWRRRSLANGPQFERFGAWEVIGRLNELPGI